MKPPERASTPTGGHTCTGMPKTGPRVGISTVAFLPHERKDPMLALQKAEDLGFSTCHFHTMFEIDPQLDNNKIKRLNEQASRLDKTLSAGLLFLAPDHPSRTPEVLRAGDGDWTRGIANVLYAAGSAGMTDLLGIIGKPQDRTGNPTAWKEQVQNTVLLLKSISPQLRDSGQRIVLKNHPEVSTKELVDVIDEVGADVVGLGFDPINVITRGEDPSDIAASYADYIAQIFVDDMVLIRCGDGVIRVPVPCGTGTIDWGRLLSILPVSERNLRLVLDLKRDPVFIPANDPEWLAAQGLTSGAAEYIHALAGKAAPGVTTLAGPRDGVEPAERLAASLAGFRAVLEKKRPRDIAEHLSS